MHFVSLSIPQHGYSKEGVLFVMIPGRNISHWNGSERRTEAANSCLGENLWFLISRLGQYYVKRIMSCTSTGRVKQGEDIKFWILPILRHKKIIRFKMSKCRSIQDIKRRIITPEHIRINLKFNSRYMEPIWNLVISNKAVTYIGTSITSCSHFSTCT